MAAYEYECGECGNRFTITETFAEHETHAVPQCPQCQSEQVIQVMDSVHVQTSKKS